MKLSDHVKRKDTSCYPVKGADIEDRTDCPPLARKTQTQKLGPIAPLSARKTQTQKLGPIAPLSARKLSLIHI